MSEAKRNEKNNEEKRVRCRCGHKMHRHYAYYPDVRLIDLPALIEKIGGRPVEPEDLDPFAMCKTCADVRRSLELPPEQAFKAHAFDFASTGKRIRQIEEERASSVKCGECGEMVPERKAFVPSFDLMKAKLGRMARLKDLPAMVACPKCLAKKDAAEKAKFYPLLSTRGQMERDEQKRLDEQRARSEKAVREALGIDVQEAPVEHREPPMRTPLGEVAGVAVTVESFEDDEVVADILSISRIVAADKKASGKGARSARRAKGEAKDAKKRHRAGNDE